MASKNQLLGLNVDFNKTEDVRFIPPQLKTPTWMFHSTCPKGRIIYTDAEFDSLDSSWVDTPTNLPEIQEEAPAESFKCEQCGKEFASSRAIKAHKLGAHRSK